MKDMKPKKTRPSQLRQQRQTARTEIQATGIKPPTSTFPRKMTPYDAALRRFQKRRINAQALAKMLESRDPILRRLAEERKAAETIRTLSLPELTRRTEDPDLDVRRAATQELAQRYAKQRNLTALTQLTKDPEWHVLETAANALTQIHAKQRNLTALTQLTKDPNWYVRKAAANALAQIKARRLMLGTRKPFAATAHLPEILKRTKKLNAVSTQLKKEFGEGFTGIVVFGSTAKGYARPERDVDYAVIASNPRAAKRFRELSTEKNLHLCSERYYVNPREKNNTTIAPLFYGLFFGDRKALKKAQRAVFTRFANNPKAWDNVRKEIFENETRLETAFKRLGIQGKREQQRLKAAAALRVPPPYKEMKKILGMK